MKKVVLPLLAVTLLLSCVQLKSKPLSSSSKSIDGFYYTLPKTFVNVEFTLKKTQIEPGVFIDYAECVGIDSSEVKKIKKMVEDKKNVIHSIEGVSITNKPYLDKSEIYQLDLNQKFLNKSDFKLEYAKNGELTSAEYTNESQVIPFLITTAKAIGDISGGTSLLGKGDKTKDGLDCEDMPKYIENEIAQISGIDGAILKLLNNSPEGTSQEQLEYRLKELKSLKNNIISKFTAKVTTKTVKVNFELDPKEITSTVSLFKFNKFLGFQRIYDKNPHNAKILITDKLPFNHNFKTTEECYDVIIELVYNDSSISQAINAKNDSQAEGSFYYRIPANVKYKVVSNNKNLGEAVLPIPQFGITLAAPKKLKNITFKLYPGLGSIYTVSGKSDSVRFGEIDSLRKTIFTSKNAKKIQKLKEELEIKNLESQLSGESNTTVEEVEEND